jgi:xanthine dehydrogenase accessory factor
MLYWVDKQGAVRSAGTIGGGHLEWRAMAVAQHLLTSALTPYGGVIPMPPERRRIERFTLGASLGQCCGGSVTLYWERFDAPEQASGLRAWLDAGSPRRWRVCHLDGTATERWIAPGDLGAAGLELNEAQGAVLAQTGAIPVFVERMVDDRTVLFLYGAGHVGQALVRVLDGLPFRVTWVDSREDVLARALADLPVDRQRDVRILADEPAQVCPLAPAGAWHLVMTHCHEQDYRVCEALFEGHDFGFLGMIGSKTKAARFRHRLNARLGARSSASAGADRLVSPIGISGIEAKLPGAIAVSIAARLLQERECRPLELCHQP